MRPAPVLATLALLGWGAGGRDPSRSGIAPPAAQGRAPILFEEGFEDDAFAARGWYDTRLFATSTVERRTGRRALEVRFATGATIPSWGRARRLFEPSESVYLSYWVKYSPNWRGSGRPYHPHEFSFLTTEDDRYVGPSRTHLTTYVEHSYRNGGIPLVGIQDGRNVDTARVRQDLTRVTEFRAVAGCNGSTDGYPATCYRGGGAWQNGKSWRTPRPYFRSVPGPGYLGDWNHVEAYFALNSIRDGVGVPDGVIRYWFNGELVIDVTNVLMRTGAHPAMRFNQLFVGPYIGDGSPVEQTMWVDDLQVGTARP